MPADKADWFLDEIRKTLENDCIRTVEYSISQDDVPGLVTHGTPDGELRFEGRIQPMAGACGGGRAVVWVARNITQRHALEGELRRQGETDPLTGVANRRKLLEQMEEQRHALIRYGTPASLIMFDLDHFKSINDRFGHSTGDEVLCTIADLCVSRFREVDLVARIGGEEFAILLTNTPLTAAGSVGERLREAASQCSIAHDEADIGMTISVGVARMLATDESINQLLERADDALYQAKHSGRNQVVVVE